MTIAYLANQFPSTLESYVGDEIRELRRRGIRVIPCSAKKIGCDESAKGWREQILVVQRLHLTLLIAAAWLCIRNFRRIRDLAQRTIFEGTETWRNRLLAMAHTYLGARFAVLLRGSGVQHIHVHHGYYSAWVAMVAARFLQVTYSMTLHGSDMLLHARYLDVKLANCLFCATISKFNRNWLLDRYPQIDASKVIVQHLGVEVPDYAPFQHSSDKLRLLAVGRLHRVKDHAFLIRCCRKIKESGINFSCVIAGDGPEERNIESLILQLDLSDCIELVGHVNGEELERCYSDTDVVVLTSRSEGIPVVLMEAMARARLVLAPAITGIPELVLDGKTGFLYEPGSHKSFVSRIATIALRKDELDYVRDAARSHVKEHFNKQKNTTAFCELLLNRFAEFQDRGSNAYSLLQ